MLVNDWGGSEWQGVEWQTRPVCERGQDAARCSMSRLGRGTQLHSGICAALKAGRDGADTRNTKRLAFNREERRNSPERRCSADGGSEHAMKRRVGTALADVPSLD